MKKRFPQNIIPLVIILCSVILTFLISRIITWLIMSKVLPPFLFVDFNGFRLHHFVYGNIIITITGFLAIGLGIRKHKNLFAVSYGIGLGLVLDEFLLWMGDVNQLPNNVMWIPRSFSAVSITGLLIATIIMIRLYELHKFRLKFKLR